MMRDFAIDKVLPVALGGVLLLTAAGTVYNFYRMLRPSDPPVEVHSADCHGVVCGVWAGEGGQRIQGEIVSTVTDVKVGRETLYLAKQVPMVEGMWCYVPRLSYQCPEASYNMYQEPACIEVR